MAPPDPSREDGLRPPIVLCASDHDLLLDRALKLLLTAPRIAGALLDEVRRARVVADDALDDGVARVGSRVTYLDGASGERRTARLVAGPAERAGELSVAASTGAALIGLRSGQAILWDERVGLRRRLVVLRVQRDGDEPRAGARRPQPE